MVRPNENLENKAELENADDEQSIRAVTAEVLNFPRSYPRIPEEIAGTIRDRASRAEMRFLRGDSGGIPEEDVVLLFNSLAKRFDAPDYAQTSPKQLRVLRMSLLLSSPVFMGKGMTRDNAQVGDSIRSAMSPLQAVYLLQSLIEQKLINPDFQFAPTEWDSNYYEHSLAAIEQLQKLRDSGQVHTSTSVFVRENPKRAEMQGVLMRGFSSMNWTDAIDLVDEVFRKLNIGD